MVLSHFSYVALPFQFLHVLIVLGYLGKGFARCNPLGIGNNAMMMFSTILKPLNILAGFGYFAIVFIYGFFAQPKLG